MEVGEKQEVKLKEYEREDQGELVDHGKDSKYLQVTQSSKGLQKKRQGYWMVSVGGVTDIEAGKAPRTLLE